jgi:hypothetical protein
MAGASRPKSAAARRYGGILLFLLPLPLLFKAIAGLWGGDIGQLFGNGASYAVSVLGALVLRRGLIREARYLERPLALTPGPPLKALGAVLIGIATGLAAHLAAGHDAIIATLFGAGALIGTLLYYGLDPRKKSLPAGDFGIGLDELTSALKAAYAKLDGINDARRAIRSREFQDRLNTIVGHSQAILKEIEEDPRDLRRARKFLNIYLDGVLGVTRKFVAASAKGGAPELEQNYRALLMDMETVCKEQHEKLRQNDVVDLDIQIEVLSTRLKREGVL